MPPIDNINDDTINGVVRLSDELYQSLCASAQKHNITLGQEIQRQVEFIYKELVASGAVQQFNDRYRCEEEQDDLSYLPYEIAFDANFYHERLQYMSADALRLYLTIAALNRLI